MRSTLARILASACSILIVVAGGVADAGSLLQLSSNAAFSASASATSGMGLHSGALLNVFAHMDKHEVAYLSGVAATDKKVLAGIQQTAKPAANHSRGKYGFYLHTYSQPKACIEQLRDLRKFHPEAPVYIMSDGGMNFSGICNKIGNCEFQWRPPANDRWNPKPFLARFKEAAKWLQTTFVVMLEPDVSINHQITYEPPVDAGGLRDANPGLGQALFSYVEGIARKKGHKDFKVSWDRFGLAGGSYVRADAAIASFDADIVDWKLLASKGDRRVFSSDVAMPIVLSAHGYTYLPWEDVTQSRFQKFWGLPNHPTALQHHGSDEGTKPNYGKPLSKDEALLVTESTIKHGKVMCQGCVWVDDALCWKQTPVACPTGPFLKS